MSNGSNGLAGEAQGGVGRTGKNSATVSRVSSSCPTFKLHQRFLGTVYVLGCIKGIVINNTTWKSWKSSNIQLQRHIDMDELPTGNVKGSVTVLRDVEGSRRLPGTHLWVGRKSVLRNIRCYAMPRHCLPHFVHTVLSGTRPLSYNNTTYIQSKLHVPW